jgi:predicted transcriptional regulator
MLTDVELKEKLIEKINNSDDLELLQQISRVFDLNAQMDDIYQMSQEETDAVNEGLNQIEKGLFLSHEESNKRVDEWLKKFGGQ